MADLVHIGSAKTDLLVPQTTLPDLLCHTITDGELALLTDRTATVMGGLCTTAFGAGLAALPVAWPVLGALVSGLVPDEANALDYGYTILFAISVVAFAITGALSGHHQLRKKGLAGIIRARPKLPMRMSEGDAS